MNGCSRQNPAYRPTPSLFLLPNGSAAQLLAADPSFPSRRHCGALVEGSSRDTPEIASLRLVCARPCAQTVPGRPLDEHAAAPSGDYHIAKRERRVLDG